MAILYDKDGKPKEITPAEVKDYINQGYTRQPRDGNGVGAGATEDDISLGLKLSSVEGIHSASIY